MRTFILVLSATVAFGIVAIRFDRILERTDVPTRLTNVDMTVKLGSRLQALHTNGWASRGFSILYLADSTGMSEPRSRSVPELLSLRLPAIAWAAPRPIVHSMIYPGFWGFDFFFLADEIATLGPDLVLLTLNAASMTETWMLEQAHPEMAAWMATRRMRSALELPLSHAGITADQLLLYGAIRATDSIDQWHQVRTRQARLGAHWQELANHLDERAGTAPDPDADREDTQRRFIARQQAQLRNRYGAMLSGLQTDNPTLTVLAATLDRLTEAGVTAMVMLFPMDLELIERRGMMDSEGLARSVNTVEQTVNEHGGFFLDLHDLLPSAGFRDDAGHFAHEKDIDAPALVADRIEEAVAVLIASGVRR